MSGRYAAIAGIVPIGGFAAGVGAEPGAARDAAARAPFDVRHRRSWNSEGLRGSPEPPESVHHWWIGRL
jgi:hypothetical protein